MKRSRFSYMRPRFGRRSVPQTRRQRRQHLQMESGVRRAGGLGGQAAEDAGAREHRAEAAAGRRHAGQCGVKGSFGKEMVTPAAERKAVAHLVDAYGMSERRACNVHDNSCSHAESLNCFGRFGNRPNESDH